MMKNEDWKIEDEILKTKNKEKNKKRSMSNII